MKIGDPLSHNRINVYECAKCRHRIHTIEKVRLFTPYSILCRKCDGFMNTAGYRIPKGFKHKPTHEWKLDRNNFPHVKLVRIRKKLR